MQVSTSRFNRRLGVVALALTIPAALSGCVFAPQAADNSVDFEGVQSATIQLQAEGTFVEPGTLDPIRTGARGSGFLIDPSGIAVTNNHVVTGAGTLKIWVGGTQEQTYGAQVLGASECLDLAVVKVDGADFPYMSWREGDIDAALTVYAAGFPLGDPNFTLTRGIVSKADVAQDFPWASLDHVVEHDARIRGGNSGGPLVDEDGHVVGVNYAGSDALDYSFAIHRDQVQGVIDDLIAGKPVLSLGINASALSPNENGEALGVWVSSVKAGGPADKAGIKAGDVLTSLSGVALARQGTLEEYCEVIRTQGSEGVIDVEVYRPSDNSVWSGQLNGKPIERAGGNEPTPPAPTPIGSFVTVTDDSGVVSVTVPDTWAQTLGVPVEGNGVTFANVTASPDLAGYNSNWSTPGVSVSATTDMSVTLDEYIAGFEAGIGSQCANAEPGDYDDGLYAGKYLYFTGCGGSAAFLALATEDVNGTHQLLLTLQMVTEEDQTVVLEQVLSSFQAQF